jgi:hypothetical protein
LRQALAKFLDLRLGSRHTLRFVHLLYVFFMGQDPLYIFLIRVIISLISKLQNVSSDSYTLIRVASWQEENTKYRLATSLSSWRIYHSDHSVHFRNVDGSCTSYSPAIYITRSDCHISYKWKCK